VGARAIDTLIEVVLITVVLAVVGNSERPYAALAIAWLIITVYETVTVCLFGATPGKSTTGIRVVSIDHDGPPAFPAAVRRAAVDGALAVTVVIGWAIWLSSTFTDSLGRGIADRAADTFVVHKHAPLPITAHDLPGFADGARAPRLTSFGRVGDLDVRMRARLRRLTDAPILAAAVGLLALAPALPLSTTAFVIASSIAWIMVFVVDETIRVTRTGVTSGHKLAGLVIVSRRTGRPPSTGASFARALVLGLTLYVPLLWPLLLVSMARVRWAGTGRALHDIAGGTLVVADPSVDPERQRQMAMQVRLGRVV